MKKLVLGIVALCVALSSAYGVCESERKRYAFCLKAVAEYDEMVSFGNDLYGYGECVNGGLQKARMKLEACLVENGYR